MQKLTQAFLKASEGEDGADSFEDDFLSVVQPVLATLDGTLSDMLAGAADGADAEEHTRLLKQAHGTIDRYLSFVQSNPVIRHLDTNPFAPLAIGKILTGTLSTISNTIRESRA